MRLATLALLTLLCSSLTAYTPSARATPVDAADPADVLEAYRGVEMSPRVPAPGLVWGHEPGERFTRHHQFVEYFEALADASDRAVLTDYGASHLGRRLITLTITSPENHERLGEIFEANRALANPRETSEAEARKIAEDLPSIVWFSYTVHGNEGSNPEAAAVSAYALTAMQGAYADDLLDNLIVVIDPVLNPDGRERYVNWFETVSGTDPNASTDSVERFEPWPGGRSNHYMFDLNRDWVWAVHPESRSRMRHYRQALPHLHIDFHEQGANSPTFLGIGDTPYSANIPQDTRDWLLGYTEAGGAAFDELGLVWSTAERFDYLYPGYGKVTPVYHGAVGILHEQGGHSRGGLALQIDESYTLTLRERIRNQVLVARAYLDHTSEMREEQALRFARYFRDSMSLSENEPAGFVVSTTNDERTLKRLFDLCETHGIEIYALANETDTSAAEPFHPARTDDEEDAQAPAPAGSWWIPTDQPMGRLVLTLMERSSEIEDPDTYDITGWSVPVMFGLEAWTVDAAPERVGADDRIEVWTMGLGSVRGASFDEAVALLVPADQGSFPTALGIASEMGLFARLTGDPITIDGEEIPQGSLLIHRVRVTDDQARAFESAIMDQSIHAIRVGGSYSESGPVLGANANRRFVLPKIMLPRGSAFSSLNFGEIWHLMDVDTPVPHTVVPANRMGRVDTDAYNVLVLPSGSPGSIMSAEDMRDWVRSGGTIVAVGSSARWVTTNVLEIEAEIDDNADDDESNRSEMTYAEREAKSVEDRIPGALFRARVDTTHPIAFGGPHTVGVIKRSARELPISDNGYAVARFDADHPVVGGAVSDENAGDIAGTPFVTHHTLGGGNVICFSDGVTLRGFNHAGGRLLLNTITLGPSFARSLQPLGEEDTEEER